MNAVRAWSALFLLVGANFCYADTFGSGANSFDIEFVRIGDPGNSFYSVANPAGSVPYRYQIAKYEISEQMIDKANLLGGLGITKDTRGPDKPATSVTWYEAAKLVNWLNTSSGFAPAYKFNGGTFQLWLPSDAGYNPNNLFRNRLARYVLPSVDEWTKAAYYDPVAGHYWDYPTGSNSIPDGIDFPGDPIFDAVFRDGAANAQPNDITDVGLLSPYGTGGQGGNVDEWEETAFDRKNDIAVEQRRTPAGSWGDIYTLLNASNTLIGIGPLFDANFVGLRVVSLVPEPNSMILLGAGCLGLFAVVRRPPGATGSASVFWCETLAAGRFRLVGQLGICR
jgi:formylglycine-generating enzyme